MKTALALALAVTSVSALADTSATFSLPSGVTVRITEAPFDKTLFKISGCTTASKACFINGRVPMGLQGGTLPQTYVKSISVSYRGRSYSLQVSDMYDAWGQRPLEYKGIRYFGGKCFDAKNCQFRGLFSDAAAGYSAEWRVVDGMPIRSVLSGSDDIVHLFMKDIDPPEFD